jgi:hypothetical protein
VLLPPLRLPPSSALHKTPHIKQLEKEAMLPSMPQSMLWPLKLTPEMMTMYTFYVCADEEDFIVSKSFTSDQHFSKCPQT